MPNESFYLTAAQILPTLLIAALLELRGLIERADRKATEQVDVNRAASNAH